MLAYDIAMAAGGEFLLRIEDIDQTRARAHWCERIFDDLRWLGLKWPEPVMLQSERIGHYQRALQNLWNKGLLYVCTCDRRDIETALSAPQEGVRTYGPDGLIYPGTCSGNTGDPIGCAMPEESVLRLSMEKAFVAVSESSEPCNNFTFVEIGSGPIGETGEISFSRQDVLQNIGDIVLSRKNMGTSYHLSVVLDDAAQGITHVVRGQDLFAATKIHVVLQKLMGLPTPHYHHHRLIRDEKHKRLAKRDDARAISKYRQDGATPQDIREMVGL
jgi:glutamyl-Q tRNA(Asp) synthetase